MKRIINHVGEGGWKSRVCWKGGGTTTTTSSSGIDKEFKPHLKEALGIATDKLRSEQAEGGAPVADQTLGRQLATDAVRGEGAFDDQSAVDRQLRNLQGQGLAQGQGTLGSARADRARQSALADASLGFQDRRQQQLQGGAEQLRSFDQQNIDAPHESLQRYFGYLGNVGSTQTQSAPKQGGK